MKNEKPRKTWEDPIVAEIRAARESYAEKFDYDIQAICRDLKKRQDASGRAVVAVPARGSTSGR